jgi:hypothetical protein
MFLLDHRCFSIPGHYDPGGATAGCNVELAFDLLGGTIIHNQLHLGIREDEIIIIDLIGSRSFNSDFQVCMMWIQNIKPERLGVPWHKSRSGN